MRGSHPSKEPEAVKDFSFRSTLLEGVARVDSAVYRGVISMLLANRVADFGDKRSILRDQPWSEIEDHHIYPVQFLRPYGLKGEPVNNIANRTPILRNTNVKINNLAPHQYIKDTQIVGVRGIAVDLVEAHGISLELISKPFSQEVYSSFVKDRSTRLLKMIAQLVETEPIEEEE